MLMQGKGIAGSEAHKLHGSSVACAEAFDFDALGESRFTPWNRVGIFDPITHRHSIYDLSRKAVRSGWKFTDVRTKVKGNYSGADAENMRWGTLISPNYLCPVSNDTARTFAPSLPPPSCAVHEPVSCNYHSHSA
jgi:hypothetical protein